MVFIVALYVPWCRHLESLVDISPQLRCSTGSGSVGNRGMLRLILLLIQVVVISLKFLSMLGVGCSKLVAIGILLCLICIGSVNIDGWSGTAPDPLVWDQGGRPKARKLAIRVNVDLASLPGPPGFFGGPWIQVDAGHISGAGTAAWPYSVGILIRFTSFLNTLHWPSGSDDFGHFGVSFWELLILFEQWAGYRLLSEKVTRPHVRVNRPILIPSVLVSEGIEIRHGCHFLSSLVRALAKLPGSIGIFLPCRIGSYMSRLRQPVFSWFDISTIGILSSSAP